MRQNEITDLEKLTPENMENIFNVYKEEDGMYYYNLLQTISFPQDLPANLFTTYDIKYEDTWPFISFKQYNTPNLWWVILLANNIHNPLSKLVPGTTIKIPINIVVQNILAQTGRPQ